MKNSFIRIIRNLLRKPVTTIINLLGLSISLALVLILSAYSFSEFTTDQFHHNLKNIYLIQPDKDWIYTPGILKPTIDNSLAGVEKSIRISDKWNPPVYQFNQDTPIESDLIFSDKEFFELFDYQVLEGDLKTALNEPMSLVISKSLAKRLFGGKSAIGRSIKLDNKHNLIVKAVLLNQTSNTVFSFNSIANIETKKRVQPSPGDFTKWTWNNYQTFLLLNDKTDIREFENEIVQLFPKEEREHYNKLKLLPFQEIYFSGIDTSWSYIKTGNKSKVIYLTIIAILVLVVALVNFINISSAHWYEKIKQTGIMKIIGAKRSTITLNILLETFLLFAISLMFAYLIVSLITPFLAIKTEIVFNPHLIFTSRYLLLTAGVVVLLSFMCGIVPALRIAYSETLINLQKMVAIKRSKSYGKGIMVAMQFIVAIVLILFTILIQKQVDFGSTNLGINQENIVGIQLTDQLHSKKEVLKELLLAQANVKDLTFTQYYPGKMVSRWGSELQVDGRTIEVEYNTFSADAGFFDLMELELLDGRFYDDNLETDKQKVVVNEQFLHEYGIDNPIGGMMPKQKNQPYEIIGVVKDFHFRPVNEPITPLVIRNDKYASVALVKLETNNFKALQISFENIKKLTAGLSPALPAAVTFFDQAVEQMYQSEVKFRRAFSLFAICAIVISCMGILAMSLFAAQQRIKEIGIRKVNGAKASEILSMLNKDFIKWVAIAFVIATPVAYYAMNKWLENFAYKTTLSWWIFALAGVLTLGIALLTVSWQSWRAATRNPVEALRYE